MNDAFVSEHGEHSDRKRYKTYKGEDDNSQQNFLLAGGKPLR